jgi:hypothetical protein
LAEDYNKLLTERFHQGRSVQSSQLAVLTGGKSTSLAEVHHNQLDMLIESDHPIVEEKLVELQNIYGKEQL